MPARKTEEAFQWIVSLLKEKNIPFDVYGGLDARVYGSQRRLADIDIEIPENRFKDLKEIKPYLVFGPTIYKDKHWKVKLATLKYKGQVIDLAGAYHAKIFDHKKKEWVILPAYFSRSVNKKVLGITVPVVTKKDLIDYKTKLGRGVDKKDIKQIA